jgi:voltage-gated sodium channel
MKSESDVERLSGSAGVSAWRVKVARVIESPRAQSLITATIIANAIVLGLESDAANRAQHGQVLQALDTACLVLFVVELSLKLAAYRGLFWRNGWNWFDFAVVGIALVPGAGVWAVLRALRVLRVLRLLTVVPQLRKVVAAFLHAIPGLGGVMAVMTIFFYTAAVLATNLFGASHPQWFGSLGGSLYTLFQVMTLESWSMGIVRPVMEVHAWAWAFFVPFIIVATFTILNLFIGIIVSTMQELSLAPDPEQAQTQLSEAIDRVEAELRKLRAAVNKTGLSEPPSNT